MTNKPTAAAAGNRATAERIVRAFNDFAERIAERTGCSKADAALVTSFYLKNKLAKIDAVNGTMSVKHGALLDDAVLARALQMIATA